MENTEYASNKYRDDSLFERYVQGDNVVVPIKKACDTAASSFIILSGRGY